MAKWGPTPPSSKSWVFDACYMNLWLLEMLVSYQILMRKMRAIGGSSALRTPDDDDDDEKMQTNRINDQKILILFVTMLIGLAIRKDEYEQTETKIGYISISFIGMLTGLAVRKTNAIKQNQRQIKF